MTLSLRIAPSPLSFRYSPVPATASGGGLRSVKQRCRIPNSGVAAAKTGFCSGGGGVLDLRKKIGSCVVVRCSLETLNVSVGEVTEVDKDTFWPIVKAAGDKLVVLDMYTQWYCFESLLLLLLFEFHFYLLIAISLLLLMPIKKNAVFYLFCFFWVSVFIFILVTIE